MDVSKLEEDLSKIVELRNIVGEKGLEDNLLPLDVVNQLPPFTNVVSQRFFAIDVCFGFGGKHTVGSVPVIGGCDHDRIDIVPRE